MNPPPRWLDVAAAWAWRVLVVAAALLALVLLLARLRLVVLPLFAALLISTALRPVARFLRRRGLPAGLAAAVSFLGFLAVVGGVVAVAARPLGRELKALRPTITKGIDDVERWLVEGPLGLEPAQLEAFRSRASAALNEGGSGFLRPAVAVAEVIGGTLLALVLTFFLVKDGPELAEAMYERVPEAQRAKARQAGAAARRALGGFLRGAALLGVVEAAIISVAMLAVGARLIIPVMLLTFIGAFVPVVGAVVTGSLAALITLVTGGPRQALIVAVVALIVQQLDNDILAPMIYGRSVKLHPLTVLLSIATGATLAGIAGTFVAVPIAAVVVAVTGAWREDRPAPTPMVVGSDP